MNIYQILKDLAIVNQHLIDKFRIVIKIWQKSCDNINNAKWAGGTGTAEVEFEFVEEVEEVILRRQDTQRR